MLTLEHLLFPDAILQRNPIHLLFVTAGICGALCWGLADDRLCGSLLAETAAT